MLVRDVLKDYGVTYLGGDDGWYLTEVENVFPLPELYYPVTLNGPFYAIKALMENLDVYILPEAQNMTKYDGTGVATVTVGPNRMDVNVPSGSSSGFTSVNANISVAATYYGEVTVYCVFYDNINFEPEIFGGSKTVITGDSITFKSVLGTIVEFYVDNVGAVEPAESSGIERISGTQFYRITGDWYAYFQGGAD